MRCSRALVVAGLAIVLLSEIQRTHAARTRTAQPVEQALADPGHSFSATMCAAMMKLNCSQHVVTKHEILCGTDHVTYPDYCVFAKARCPSSSTIRMDHEGPCIVTPSPASHMTTIPPNTATWGHDPAFDLIKDVFCTNINLITCGNNVDSDICATDGKVYTNQCLFAKVKCFKPDLEPTNPAKCHENGLPLKSTPTPFLVG